MSWYQHKDQFPTHGLPVRLRLDDGSVIRNLDKLSSDELNNLGIATVAYPPEYDETSQDLIWNTENSTWEVTTTTDVDKINMRWEKIEKCKKHIIVKINKKLEKRYDNNIGLSSDFVQVIDCFDNIETISNPFSIDIINSESIGITTTNINIPQDELALVNEAFTEVAHEYILPKNYESESSYCRAMIKEYWGIDCCQGNLDLVPDHIHE